MIAGCQIIENNPGLILRKLRENFNKLYVENDPYSLLLLTYSGDPDKCDNYGNTALHFAAARGHLHCVTFLVNFGVNMWALDIDYHTPKDLAAINNKEEILRFLDAAIDKAEATDKKKVCYFLPYTLPCLRLLD